MSRSATAGRAATLLVVVAAVLGLSGCFKASQDVRVRADGTGSVVLHIEVDKRALDAILRGLDDIGGGGATAPGMLAPFRPVDRTFPDGTKVLAVDGADRATLDASFDFRDAEDYERRLKQVSAAVSINPDAAFGDDGSIRIRRAGDRMEVAVDLGSSAVGDADLDFPALAGLVDPASLPTAVFTITMPGSIVTSNGREQGRMVTWDLLSRGAPSTLTATSTVDRPGLPSWALPTGAGLFLALLLLMLGIVVVQRRRPVAAGGSAEWHQPSPWPPASPPSTATFFPPPPGVLPAGSPVWPSPAEAPPAPRAAPPTEAWPAAPSSAPPPRERSERSSAPPAMPGPPVSPWAPPPAPGVVAPPPSVPAAATEPLASSTAAPVPEPTQTVPWLVPGDPADVAQPPSTAAVPAPAPGWYGDPGGTSRWRYWDGHRWTEHVQ